MLARWRVETFTMGEWRRYSVYVNQSAAEKAAAKLVPTFGAVAVRVVPNAPPKATP